MRGIAILGILWAGALAVAIGPPALASSGAGVGEARQSRSLFPGTLDQHPAIDYRASTLTDPITALQRNLTAGSASLEFEGRLGFLRSLLTTLNVPVESQILLFSKTGIQHPFTNPENPRALYFNDRVIVGYIPGAPMLEAASQDPRQGVIFQTLPQEVGLGTPPRFVRPDRCLTCHLSANSLGVPGILVRSMFTEATGRTRPQLGSAIVDHRTPLEQRWGGWYVTGTHGAARHMGNAMVTIALQRGEDAISDSTLNRVALDARVDVSAYPAASSDITALLVFDHQGHAMNLLTRLGWEARIAAADGAADFSKGELRALAHDTADYLLLVDEPALPAPVRGISRFADVFSGQGPRDRKGRSLRELDLQTRLFKYRCSYMILSPVFDALPAEAKAAVFARMHDVLAKRQDGVVIEMLDQLRPGWRSGR
jgi:hypothetical protein